SRSIGYAMLIISPKSSVRRMREGDIFVSASRVGMRAPVWSWHEAQYCRYTCSPAALVVCAREASSPSAAINPQASARATMERNWMCRMLEPSLDPLRRIVVEVLHRIGVLARYGFTRDARRLAVFCSLDDNEILVGACRDLVVNLVVTDEIMRAHRRNQQRHANAWQVARGRVVAGAVIDAIHRVGGANSVRAQERRDGQKQRAVGEGLVFRGELRVRAPDALDNLGHDRSVVL